MRPLQVFKNKTVNNIISLSLVQGMNYILPLITLPYLVRVLTVHGYGLLTFSVAFMQYFLIFTQFGFNYSATQRIAEARDDKKERSRIFFSVLTAKLLFSIVSFSMLIIITNQFSYFAEVKYIIWLSFIAVFGDVLFPIWFFQGEEKMSNIAIANISSKLSTVPFIFIFVKDSSDIAIAALIMGSANLIAGILALIKIFSSKRVSFCIPKIIHVWIEIKMSWHFFLSSAAMSLYTVSTPVLLGAICGPYVLGVFSAADKLRQALQGLLNPVSQALYPKITRMMRDQPKDIVFRFLRKLLAIQSTLGFMVSIICSISAGIFIPMIYGKGGTQEVIIVFQILSWVPFIVSISNVLGIQTLLTIGHKRVFSKVIIIGGVFNIMLVTLLAFNFQAEGAAVAILITEAVITLCMMSAIFRLNIPLFKW
ncbi:flippase [Enterobacter cloacae]